MKSHVSMEQRQCVVCGHTYDTGAILLDKRLKASMEPKTVTGYGLCPDDQKKSDDGYIALVGIIPPASGLTVKPEDAHRTGEIVHMKRHVFEQFVNMPDHKGPMIFVESGVIDIIKQQLTHEE